jgi:acetolactate synthase-1/2/3 large subunit
MSGAQFMAETLHGYGVGAVFFVPAILKRVLVELERLGVRRVLCHSEKAAAYMADGYARASGRLGVAMAQSVGAANLAAGLQDAYLGLSPVMAVTGRRPPIELYRHAYQEIDHRPLFQPVTKFSGYVDDVNQLPIVMRLAMREAMGGAPGPVNLELLGWQGEVVADAVANLEVVIDSAFTRIPPFRPEPEAHRIREATTLLAEAKRPVLVAGGGAAASQAGPEILALAEMLAMPVATSLNAKGIVPEDHPLAVGVVGSYSRWCANRVVSEADLVVFVGSHTGGQVTHSWQVPRPGTRVIQIDLAPSELGRSYPAAVALLGDAKVTLQRLVETLSEESSSPRRTWSDQASEWLTQWRREVDPLLLSDASPIRPERLCREISNLLPDGAILVSDTGHAGMWSGMMIELTSPGQRYLRAAGSLGWAFPAALGAKCARPDQPVICFTGDGGFWYHFAELETAVRCSIPTVTVINNNHSLNQGKASVEQAYQDMPDGHPEELWTFGEVDFSAIAQSIGAFGIRVERPGELAAALEQALSAGRPAVVDVVTDQEALAPLALVP